MTQEEIKNYNRLCAEFLGYELITPQMRKRPEQWKDNSYWEHKDKANVHTSKKVLGRDGYLAFHSDWNCIMEVVEAIEKLGETPSMYGILVDITTTFVKIRQSLVDLKLTPMSKKEAVVQAINQFLIWYEQNK